MIVRIYLTLCLCLTSIFAWSTVSETNEHLRKVVEYIRLGHEATIESETIYCRILLPEFYLRNSFSLAWDAQDKKQLLKVLENAPDDGLFSKDYHYDALIKLNSSAKTLEQKAELDLLFTDAFLLYASHFLNGKVNPETVDGEWKAVRREGNAREFLEQALASGNIESSLRSLKPIHSGYDVLKKQLAVYKNLAASGGWETIPEGPTLKVGMTDSIRIPKLIDRLVISGDLVLMKNNNYELNTMIEGALKKYQTRNGLEVDGALGKQTTESLNIPIEERINQILINLERYRWIAQDLGEHYVIVNIADFQMQVFRQGNLTFEENVIVGKTFRKTPVFSSKMTYMVLNPYWVVPPTILFQDFLPEIQKNPAFLTAKNIKVLKGFGSGANIVDPTTVDWKQYSKNNFPFTLRQDPGPTNALGQVKFIFPNNYNVYIHDTPSKEMFQRADRAFSSGCIRLKNPMNFTHYLIKDNPKWNKEAIDKIMREGKEYTIFLDKPVNVHILYLTSWVEKGELQFRKDIYNRDQPLLNALLQDSSKL
ncbi:L,D-transpeptidase family protein [Reichenbachiella sp.]